MGDSNPALSLELDRRFRATCKIVLGGEVGPLSDYSQWLSESADKVYHKKTASGQEVAFSIDEYCEGSQRVSFENIDFGKKAAPLALDDIKDIDSLAIALSERFSYCGNIILGNSKYVEKSANVSDSFYVYNSSQIGDSKYLAYASMGRQLDHVFGCSAPGNSSFLISCIDTYFVQRAFELWMTADASDCYYVYALKDCKECMFSFNLRGAHHAIGNVSLPKEKYLGLKAALLEQIRGELEKKKRAPSLSEMFGKGEGILPAAKAALKGRQLSDDKEKKSIKPMDEAFGKTSELLLGRPLSGVKNYKSYLCSRIRTGERRKSVISGKEMFVADYARYSGIPKGREVLSAESVALAESLPPLENIEKLTLQNASEYLSKIAFFPLDYAVGANVNMIDCMTYAESVNCLQCAPCVKMKDSAYVWWPRTSEHLFGCAMMFDSSFCIHCYQSSKLSRCFEVDSSRDCSDCYFCHNCENVQNGIFCFNSKNLRYAVGNVEVGKEKFYKVKAMLLRSILPALESGRAPGIDIFNIACKGKKK